MESHKGLGVGKWYQSYLGHIYDKVHANASQWAEVLVFRKEPLGLWAGPHVMLQWDWKMLIIDTGERLINGAIDKATKY